MSPVSIRARVARLLGEFTVILVGVLAALAADRWNEARHEARTEDLYLERLASDLRRDSIEAASYLNDLPDARAARDSLLSAVEGSGTLPQDLRDAVFRAWLPALLPPVVTWTELNSSGSTVLISDIDERIAVAEYYAFRNEAETYLAAGERRGRDPFVDARYRIGVVETPPRDDAATSFLAWPGIREDLIGLGGHYWVMERYLTEVIGRASSTLQQLEDGT